jgi:RAD51-like protein 1
MFLCFILLLWLIFCKGARLQGLEEAIIEHRIKLLVIDSIAALVLSEYGRDRIIQRQEVLGQLASVLK